MGLLRFLALSCSLVFSGVVAAETPRPSRRPNVVLIVADDLGYGELGCQGYSRDIPTPNIDGLARDGVRMTSGYVSCPVCSPTRAGLMTGRYQQRFGHEYNPAPGVATAAAFGLPLGETTLAARLKKEGYATGMVGKWHLGSREGYQPTSRGFDRFFGFLGGAHSYQNLRRGILRGDQPVRENEYLTDAFAREALAFLDENKGRPFFLYLPFNAVHAPLEVPPHYLKRFPAIQDEKRKTFAAMLSALDDGVGAVLKRVHDLDLDEETLVIFHSDNGGPTVHTSSGNGPLNGHKAQLLEGGIRVPYLMRWAGHLPAGKVYDRPVITLDVAPTVLATVGAKVAEEYRFDGVNLLPYLEGKAEGPPHEALYWRYGDQHAIRQGPWKLVKLAREAQPRLFNLDEDLGETRDRAGDHPEVLRRLQASYKTWDNQLIAPRWEPGE